MAEQAPLVSRYEIGQYVKIYFDPLTERDLEGDAKLVKIMQEVGVYSGRVANLWKVKFRGESNSYLRILLEPINVEVNKP